jgi:hypothetical protein
MFKGKFYNYLLVIVGLLLVEITFSQQIPKSGYRLALPGGINTPVSSGSYVCPSLDTTGEYVASIDTFKVPVSYNDAGVFTYFEWVVYGGIIVDANGTNPGNEATGTQKVGKVPYFYLSNDQYSSGSYSTIQVQWHTADMVNPDSAWVAVRQLSEWGCTDSLWSVFTNEIFDPKPVFNLSNPTFPKNIAIAYDQRAGYVLPNPQLFTTDAGCPRPLSYAYTITRPGSTPLEGSYTDQELTAAGGLIELSENLNVGVDTVTWTITDGMKSIDSSYTVTVEPLPAIENIAWTHPSCVGGSDGTIFISQLLDFPFLQVDYSFNGGGYFSGGTSAISLVQGTYTVIERVHYVVDKNNDGDTSDPGENYYQLSPEYDVQLNDPPSPVIVSLPDPPDQLINTPCASSSTGDIWIDKSLLIRNNQSLSFTGDDYILMNHSLTGTYSNYSFAAWIKVPNGSSDREEAIVSFDDNAFFKLSVTASTGNGTRNIVFATRSSSLVNGVLTHSTKINDGIWHFVVAVYSNGTNTLYVDGIPEVWAGTNGPAIGQTGVTRFGIIGAKSSSTKFENNPLPNYFIGQIAEVALWESALSTANVLTMMADGIKTLNPSAHWLLDDVPSNIAAVSGQDSVMTDFGNQSISDLTSWARNSSNV